MKLESDSLGFRVWPGGPHCPSLPCSGSIHVWRIQLARWRENAASWWLILSADEKDRANRFHFEGDRETWLITRGVLRTLLGRYLEVPAYNLEFIYNEAGKPALHPRFRDRDLRFSVSHSGQCSLLAFASCTDIGVDIESKHGHPDIEQVAPSVLSPDELAVFQTLRPGLRHAAMFAAWTRKEAILKALGTGLSLAPELVEVTFAPDEEPALRRAPDLPIPSTRWSLQSLDVADDYASALAAPMNPIQVSLWDFLESDGAC